MFLRTPKMIDLSFNIHDENCYLKQKTIAKLKEGFNF